MTDSHRLVFVGGLHRSGTTLVARLLGEHPSISGFRNTGVPEDEGQYLQTVYPGFGGWGRFGFNPHSHMTERSSLVTDQNRHRLYADWARHWDLDRPVLLEKSPANITKTRFLQAMFPDARFVMVIRHPIAVAQATARWSRPIVPGAGRGREGSLLREGPDWVARRVVRSLKPLSNVRHWVACHETLLVDAPHLRHIALVYYEDLVAEPQAEVDRLCAFLEIPAELPTPRVKSGLNESYLREWRGRGVNPAKSLYSAVIAARYEQRVNRLGYSFGSLARLTASPLEHAVRPSADRSDAA